MKTTIVEANLPTRISASANSGIESSRRLRLVLADDDQRIREYLCFFLQSEHDIVDAVADGAEALRRTDELQPDILLLDISMPGLNGFKVARELRHHDSPVKIIFVSAHTEPAYLEEARRIGVEGFVAKRRAQTELAIAIRQVDRGIFYVSPELMSS